MNPFITKILTGKIKYVKIKSPYPHEGGGGLPPSQSLLKLYFWFILLRPSFPLEVPIPPLRLST